MATTNSLLACLALFCVAMAQKLPPSVDVDAGSYKDPHVVKGPSIDEVRYALFDLENYIATDFALHSDAALLLAGGVELFNFIFDERVPSLEISNAEQDRITGILATQIADLEALSTRVEVALGSALSGASDNNLTASELQEFLQEVSDRNAEQAGDIADLREKLVNIKGSLEVGVAVAVAGSGGDNSKLFALLEDLNLFIDGRICEIGTASIPPGEFEVFFKIAFDEDPQVSLGLTGFSFRADVKNYGKYDSLSLDKHVFNVTRDSFFVSAVDISDGMVAVDTIYCVYMACQNLDRDYVPPTY